MNRGHRGLQWYRQRTADSADLFLFFRFFSKKRAESAVHMDISVMGRVRGDRTNIAPAFFSCTPSNPKAASGFNFSLVKAISYQLLDAEPLPAEEFPVFSIGWLPIGLDQKTSNRKASLKRLLDFRVWTQGKMAGNRIRSQPILTSYSKIHKSFRMNEAKIEFFTLPSPAPHPTRGPQSALI